MPCRTLLSSVVCCLAQGHLHLHHLTALHGFRYGMSSAPPPLRLMNSLLYCLLLACCLVYPLVCTYCFTLADGHRDAPRCAPPQSHPGNLTTVSSCSTCYLTGVPSATITLSCCCPFSTTTTTPSPPSPPPCPCSLPASHA